MSWRWNTSTSKAVSLSLKESNDLEQLNLASIGDLVYMYPLRYEDRAHFKQWNRLEAEEVLCLTGEVVEANWKGKGRYRWYEIILEAEDKESSILVPTITCRWFGMRFIHRWIFTGKRLVLYGKLKSIKGRWVIDHPELEVIGEDEKNSLHFGRVVPIYRGIKGVSKRRVREILFELMTREFPEDLPIGIENSSEKRWQFLRQLHFPETVAQGFQARRKLALDEWIERQLAVLWRQQNRRRSLGCIQGEKTVLLQKFKDQLPFSMTKAQHRCLEEIRQDMQQPFPMYRLLQGDVGSGKTVVAMGAILLAVESGNQAALMVPTQILAEQHYASLNHLLKPIGVEVGLLTGQSQSGQKNDFFTPDVWVGTHALIYQEDLIERLKLVVIDEQHKFGVAQRAKLISHGEYPDVLVMTATPIPRTLTLTLYGDLEVSVLDQKPEGRGEIVTGVRVKPKINEIKSFLKEKLEQGQQVYLVYPRVDAEEEASAISAFEKWSHLLGDYGVGLLHGRLKSEEKQIAMERFKKGEDKLLVATSVIEVGVDVSQATVMLIFEAQRFGLAQLHQLRGRVGRGSLKSYCVLITQKQDDEVLQKLNLLAGLSDGFELAEADLEIRGAGELFGSQQTGKGDLHFAKIGLDVKLVETAREKAKKILNQDPNLENFPDLRQRVKEHLSGFESNPEGQTYLADSNNA